MKTILHTSLLLFVLLLFVTNSNLFSQFHKNSENNSTSNNTTSNLYQLTSKENTKIHIDFVNHNIANKQANKQFAHALVNKNDNNFQVDTSKYFIDYGKMFRCDSSTSRFGFRNNGTAGLWQILFTTTIEGPDRNLFSYQMSKSLPANLQPGDSIEIYATFNSLGSTFGVKTAYFYLSNIFFRENGNQEIALYMIELTAEVINGITVTPNLLDFGDVDNQQVRDEILRLDNQTNKQITIQTCYLQKGTNSDFNLETDLDNQTMNGRTTKYATISIKSDIAGEKTDTLIFVILNNTICDDTLRIPIKANVKEPPPPPIYDLVLIVNHSNIGTAKGSGEYTAGTKIEIEAVAEDCYKFASWTNADGTIISTESKDTIILTSDSVLVANFEYACPVIFTIRASTHEQIDPRTRDYPIPIFIKADADVFDVSNAVIEKLVIRMDKYIYNPTSALDNGVLTKRFIDYDNSLPKKVEMVIENVQIPLLNANEEKTLLTINGDVMLGNKDSSSIDLRDIEFTGFLSKFNFIDGFITIEICRAGGNRLLNNLDFEPSLTIKRNPVSTGILEVECKTIEKGDYILEILDYSGNTMWRSEWQEPANGRIFNLEIPVQNLAGAAYILRMQTPTNWYAEKFLVE